MNCFARRIFCLFFASNKTRYKKQTKYGNQNLIFYFCLFVVDSEKCQVKYITTTAANAAASTAETSSLGSLLFINTHYTVTTNNMQ